MTAFINRKTREFKFNDSDVVYAFYIDHILSLCNHCKNEKAQLLALKEIKSHLEQSIKDVIFLHTNIKLNKGLVCIDCLETIVLNPKEYLFRQKLGLL